ncbi:MAG: hypothetical protein FWF52_08975 [Candidatus Azobacteroides sp.]|nr:hypothetical protein [Candidatus Azobacteroides sp.]
MDQSIIDLIKQRKSVRTYTSEPLSREHTDEIAHFIERTKVPFGVKARVEFIHTGQNDQKVQLGTYGWIDGASDYMALIYEESPLGGEGSAYWFEQVILFCTGLGLGTCWLGGSFSRKDFKKQVRLEANEKLRIVSPVGYPASKKRLLESIIGADKHHQSRKPFGAYFYYRQFTTPLTEEMAGIYAQPLEMVRIAPSANNAQPWRIVWDEENFHFYRTPSFGFSDIDMGIALCHFEQSCRELGLSGRFETENIPSNKNMQYVISWIPE